MRRLSRSRPASVAAPASAAPCPSPPPLPAGPAPRTAAETAQRGRRDPHGKMALVGPGGRAERPRGARRGKKGAGEGSDLLEVFRGPRFEQVSGRGLFSSGGGVAPWMCKSNCRLLRPKLPGAVVLPGEYRPAARRSEAEH